MGNERLRGSLAERGISVADLAQQVRVDPKTVERWVQNGRVPHRAHRWATARALGTDATYLWPDADRHREPEASAAELVALHPNRGAVPPELWRDTLLSADAEVDVLVYAGLFLFDSNPDLVEQLAERARAGVRIRLAIGDPDSQQVALRGEEEGLDVSARARITLKLIDPLRDVDGVEIRLHQTPLYASIYRGDGNMLVNSHAYGSMAMHSPVLQLQRVPGGKLFNHYLDSCEKVWERGVPYR